MTRFLVLALTITSFGLQISCSSKDKKEDTVAVGDVSSDPNVSAKDMKFDPMGSDSGEIEGLNTVNFEYDQANLTTETRRLLAENAEWIKGNTDTTIQIEGHCDSRGSIEYNLSLGERRAKAVKTYLVSLGIEPQRMTIISYGEEKPLDPAESEQAWSKNRRANFVPLPNN